MKLGFAGAITMSLFVFQAHSEELTIQTPRGTTVHISIDRPSALGDKFPALVIAPGQGYHKELPLVKTLAAKAAMSGVVVYRFDWSYFSADPKSGQPSADLKNEVEDMLAVVEKAKSDPSVEAGKIVLAGKSLGTLVSYQLFNSDKGYRGLVLLTPLCTDPDSGAAIGNESYPNFVANSRPISLVLGNTDPMCQLPMLYDFLRPTAGNVSVNTFTGGHSLTIGKPGDPVNAKIDDASIDSATTVAALWINFIALK
jgi:predicted esterase